MVFPRELSLWGSHTTDSFVVKAGRRLPSADSFGVLSNNVLADVACSPFLRVVKSASSKYGDSRNVFPSDYLLQ